MRHRQSGRQLNRNSSHRSAMFRNMTTSLVEHEIIKTTLIKAKELRSVAEPLITLAKKDSVANRRLAFNRTRSKATVGKLFTELGPRYVDRPGGYIRILKCGERAGDKATMAYVELVDRPLHNSNDLNEEVEKIFEKTGRTAWNQMRKLQAIPGAYASYDYYMDPDQLLSGKVVPCYSAMLTPQLCRKIQDYYQDDFTASVAYCY